MRGLCATKRPTCTYLTHQKLAFDPSISKSAPPFFFLTTFLIQLRFCARLFVAYNAETTTSYRCKKKWQKLQKKTQKSTWCMTANVWGLSALYSRGKSQIVDISDAYQKFREKMIANEKMSSTATKTPETLQQTHAQTQKGQWFLFLHPARHCRCILCVCVCVCVCE